MGFVAVYRAVRIPSDVPEARHQLPTGFYYLVDDDELNVLEHVLLFLVNKFIHRGRYRAKHSQRDAAYDLADWFRFLMDVGRAWDDIDADLVAEYRDSRENRVSAQTHELIKTQTVIRRMLCIFSFYKYAKRRKWVPSELDIEELEDRRGGRPPSQPDESRAFRKIEEKVSSLLPVAPSVSQHVSYILPENWTRIRSELGPMPSEASGPRDATSCRNRLAAELAYLAGPRVDEIAHLTVQQITSIQIPNGAVESTELPIQLVFTKNNGQRTIYIQYYLYKELILYINELRPTCLKYIEDSDAAKKEFALFLNGPDARRFAGRRTTAETLSKSFHQAVLRAGLMKEVVKINPDTSHWYIAQVALYRFHDLRHSFAMDYVIAHHGGGQTVPWKKLQSRLGHRWLSTTLNIYLNHLELAEGTVSHVHAIMFKEIRRLYGGN